MASSFSIPCVAIPRGLKVTHYPNVVELRFVTVFMLSGGGKTIPPADWPAIAKKFAESVKEAELDGHRFAVRFEKVDEDSSEEWNALFTAPQIGQAPLVPLSAASLAKVERLTAARKSLVKVLAKTGAANPDFASVLKPTTRRIESPDGKTVREAGDSARKIRETVSAAPTAQKLLALGTLHQVKTTSNVGLNDVAKGYSSVQRTINGADGGADGGNENAATEVGQQPSLDDMARLLTQHPGLMRRFGLVLHGSFTVRREVLVAPGTTIGGVVVPPPTPPSLFPAPNRGIFNLVLDPLGASFPAVIEGHSVYYEADAASNQPYFRPGSDPQAPLDLTPEAVRRFRLLNPMDFEVSQSDVFLDAAHSLREGLDDDGERAYHGINLVHLTDSAADLIARIGSDQTRLANRDGAQQQPPMTMNELLRGYSVSVCRLNDRGIPDKWQHLNRREVQVEKQDGTKVGSGQTEDAIIPTSLTTAPPPIVGHVRSITPLDPKVATDPIAREITVSCQVSDGYLTDERSFKLNQKNLTAPSNDSSHEWTQLSLIHQQDAQRWDIRGLKQDASGKLVSLGDFVRLRVQGETATTIEVYPVFEAGGDLAKNYGPTGFQDASVACTLQGGGLSRRLLVGPRTGVIARDGSAKSDWLTSVSPGGNVPFMIEGERRNLVSSNQGRDHLVTLGKNDLTPANVQLWCPSLPGWTLSDEFWDREHDTREYLAGVNPSIVVLESELSSLLGQIGAIEFEVEGKITRVNGDNVTLEEVGSAVNIPLAQAGWRSATSSATIKIDDIRKAQKFVWIRGKFNGSAGVSVSAWEGLPDPKPDVEPGRPVPSSATWLLTLKNSSGSECSIRFPREANLGIGSPAPALPNLNFDGLAVGQWIEVACERRDGGWLGRGYPRPPLVFISWGSPAKDKIQLTTTDGSVAIVPNVANTSPPPKDSRYLPANAVIDAAEQKKTIFLRFGSPDANGRIPLSAIDHTQSRLLGEVVQRQALNNQWELTLSYAGKGKIVLLCDLGSPLNSVSESQYSDDIEIGDFLLATWDVSLEGRFRVAAASQGAVQIQRFVAGKFSFDSDLSSRVTLQDGAAKNHPLQVTTPAGFNRVVWGDKAPGEAATLGILSCATVLFVRNLLQAGDSGRLPPDGDPFHAHSVVSAVIARWKGWWLSVPDPLYPPDKSNAAPWLIRDLAAHGMRALRLRVGRTYGFLVWREDLAGNWVQEEIDDNLLAEAWKAGGKQLKYVRPHAPGLPTLIPGDSPRADRKPGVPRSFIMIVSARGKNGEFGVVWREWNTCFVLPPVCSLVTAEESGKMDPLSNAARKTLFIKDRQLAREQKPLGTTDHGVNFVPDPNSMILNVTDGDEAVVGTLDCSDADWPGAAPAQIVLAESPQKAGPDGDRVFRPWLRFGEEKTMQISGKEVEGSGQAALDCVHAVTEPLRAPQLRGAKELTAGLSLRETLRDIQAEVEVDDLSTHAQLGLNFYWNEHWDAPFPKHYVAPLIRLEVENGQASRVTVLNPGAGLTADICLGIRESASRGPVFRATIVRGQLAKDGGMTIIDPGHGIQTEPGRQATEVVCRRRAPLARFATAKVQFKDGAKDGPISKVILMEKGSGYSSPPFVIAHDPLGQGRDAQLTAVLKDGVVDHIDVLQGGELYSDQTLIGIYTHHSPAPQLKQVSRVTDGTRYVRITTQLGLPDPRARRAVLEFSASSRYRETLNGVIKALNPKADLNSAEAANGSVGLRLRPRSRLSNPLGIELRNALPLSAPRFDHVMPSFAWQQSVMASGSVEVVRDTVFRLYLRRPWLQTGVEQLGIVVREGTPAAFPIGDPSDPDKNLEVSTWGFDPIWPKANMPALSLEDFETKAGYQRFAETLGPLDLAPAGLALHEVDFEPRRNLWYADVTMIPRTSDAFVRLALCRFNPDGIREARYSGVTMTEPIPLSATRRWTIAKTAENRIEVRLNGPSLDQGPRREVRIEIRRKALTDKVHIQGGYFYSNSQRNPAASELFQATVRDGCYCAVFDKPPADAIIWVKELEKYPSSAPGMALSGSDTRADDGLRKGTRLVSLLNFQIQGSEIKINEL